MNYRDYVRVISEFLNTSSDEKERSRRIELANWALFEECVGGTRTQAKLALAEAAAQQENGAAPERGDRPATQD